MSRIEGTLMAAMSVPRYQMREEADGTWTVFDTMPMQGNEARIMYGITEKRAIQYLVRLNQTASAVPGVDSEQHD
jgi:hypothetical protein